MKKIKSAIYLSVIALLMLVSCNTTDENLRSMIPDDAVGIISIDVPTLLTKASILKGDTVELPDDLKQVIDNSDATVFGDLIYNLPVSGIDLKSKCYIFFSPGIFKAVALIPLVDEEASKLMVQKITSSKMIELNDVFFATHLDYAYVISDKVLFIGRYSNPVDEKVASNAARDVLGKTKPSIFNNKEVSENFTDSCDVSAFINVKEFTAILKTNSRFSTVFGNFPAIDIITDCDIKAMTATVNFNFSKKEGDSAQIDTRFIYIKNGQYSQLYDNLIVSSTDSASSILSLIPGELDTYVAVKIDGGKLCAMPQMSKMFEILEATPLTLGLKHSEMISSIKGALAFGIGKSTVGDHNFVIATQTSDPDLIINQIVEVASKRGQSPLQRRGEYVYDYGGQGIAMGKRDNAFYLRCVDFETGFSADELPVLPYNLDKSSIAVYQQVKIGDKIEGFLNWGLHDKSHGTGLYFTANENSNVVVSILKYLCWKDPNSSVEENEDNFDYGF